MDKKSTDSPDLQAVEATKDLVRALLGEGISVPKISFALAYVATDLGLQMAPSAEAAIAVVTDAISRTAKSHALAGSKSESSENADSSGGEAEAMDTKVFGRMVH